MPDPDSGPDKVSGSLGAQEVQARKARLAAMSQPRPDDPPELARLRAVLRDNSLMERVCAAVDAWPDPTDEQLATIAALCRPRLSIPAQRRAAA
jgi:hypothetical protein